MRRKSERSKQVNIRLTDVEAAALLEHAEAANLDLSTFVRRKALERIVKPDTRRVMSSHTAQVVRALTTVGLALQQIVRLYETENGEVRAQLLRCLQDVQDALLSLRT